MNQDCGQTAQINIPRTTDEPMMEKAFKEDCVDECNDSYPTTGSVRKKGLNSLESLNLKLSLRDKSFCGDIKTLLIPHPKIRVICSFFGITEPGELVNSFFVGQQPIIGDLVVQCVQPYMEELGYKVSAELIITDESEVFPVGRKSRKVKGKSISYVHSGLVFYENKVLQDKVVFQFIPEQRGLSFLAFHHKQKFVDELVCDIKDYARENNFLRGAKIRSVNPQTSEFCDMHDEIGDKYNWDNYYYPKEIIDICNKDIFGFLKNSKKYITKGIKRRGVLCYGKPGTGKTSIGKVLCNFLPDHSVIWVTPDMAIQLMTNIYELARYLKPCVVILEDLDLFAEDRDSSSENFRLGVLMNILDGVNSIEETVTFATTNRIDLIEKALQNRPGRFDRVVHIPTLSEDLRKKFIENNLSDYLIKDDIVDFLVEETERGQGSSWTGAELAELINSIKMNLVFSGKSSKKITIKMAEEALKTVNTFIFNKREQDKKPPIGFGD